MKYMGSKRLMLQNGLGELIRKESADTKRIVDLFCGAGYVSWFAAENTYLPIYAIDLQKYAVTLANAVISRDYAIDESQLDSLWLTIAQCELENSPLWNKAKILQNSIHNNIKEYVFLCREICGSFSETGPIWNSYGGYYLSPIQALTIDFMLKYLPTEEPNRSVCIAATIFSTSKCVAAPGHTAQPFQPNDRTATHILSAWNFDPLQEAKNALSEICPKHAYSIGRAITTNALDFAKEVNSDDLVIIDPPYSGVQYSRFYHVFETIARGCCGGVTGNGRYPPFEERPQSDFSKKSLSKRAMQELINSLIKSHCKIIITFPIKECSNGLSGETILNMATDNYKVDFKTVKGSFSTLGGNNSRRASRNASEELIILMKPK